MNRRAAQKTELAFAAIAQSEAQAALAVTVLGTPGHQSIATQSFIIFATTIDAATTTIDTGYKPVDGHAAKIDGGLSFTDRTAHFTSTRNSNVALQNYGGLSIRGSQVSGQGDIELANATMTFGVSGGGTLEITFTPPAGYTGTLEWLYEPTMTEN